MSYITFPNPWQAKPAAVQQLRDYIVTDPKASDEKRYEALRLASEGSPHATSDEVVKRAEAYFNFLKGE